MQGRRGNLHHSLCSILYRVHVVTILFVLVEVVCFTSIYQWPDSPAPWLVRPDVSCLMESRDPWQWGSPLPHSQPWWTSVGERWGILPLPVKADAPSAFVSAECLATVASKNPREPEGFLRDVDEQELRALIWTGADPPSTRSCVEGFFFFLSTF